MKTVYRFVLKAYVGPMVLTFFIVMFILLMHYLWMHIDELVGKGLGPGVIVELVFYASATSKYDKNGCNGVLCARAENHERVIFSATLVAAVFARRVDRKKYFIRQPQIAAMRAPIVRMCLFLYFFV